jgi:hypothetical protein
MGKADQCSPRSHSNRRKPVHTSTVRVEQRLMLGRGEVVFRTLVFGLNVRVALHRFVVSEVGDGVVAENRRAVLVLQDEHLVSWLVIRKSSARQCERRGQCQ